MCVCPDGHDVERGNLDFESDVLTGMRFLGIWGWQKECGAHGRKISTLWTDGAMQWPQICLPQKHAHPAAKLWKCCCVSHVFLSCAHLGRPGDFAWSERGRHGTVCLPSQGLRWPWDSGLCSLGILSQEQEACLTYRKRRGHVTENWGAVVNSQDQGLNVSEPDSSVLAPLTLQVRASMWAQMEPEEEITTPTMEE